MQAVGPFSNRPTIVVREDAIGGGGPVELRAIDVSLPQRRRGRAQADTPGRRHTPTEPAVITELAESVHTDSQCSCSRGQRLAECAALLFLLLLPTGWPFAVIALLIEVCR